ncbi:MAG: ABC transporter ATP-binding protein [Paracoccaceae bacterium]|nr:ABC transporter ATP-binding protein [Paracoccaceae bacterium]
MLDTTHSDPLLELRDIDVSLGKEKRIVQSMNLNLNRGEVVAVIGESGSGKSVTALAATRLLPAALKITRGQVLFNGQDLLGQSERQLNAVRGGEIGMLFQQPQAMLDPSSRVHAQISEPLRRHRGISGRAAFREVVALLESVGIPSPERRAMAFPHELSGGMAQRVMIAAALAGQPKLLIADEPTTALDVTVQTQILRLLAEKRREHNLAILLITHDFSVVSAFADRVVVMYGGRVMEEGPTDELMREPQHPYTRALIRCSLLQPDETGLLPVISGSSTRAIDLVQGCCFAPRCTEVLASGAQTPCKTQRPALTLGADGRKTCCHVCHPELCDHSEALS